MSSKLRMDELTKGILSAKLLEVCGCDIDTAIYAFIPTIDENIRLHTNSLHMLPKILDSAISIFANSKTNIAKNSNYYIKIKKEHDQLIRSFNDVCEFVGYKGQKKIGESKVHATLSYISHIYFDAFIEPIQFFLPNSSICSGKWEFWDSIDFFAYKEKLQNKQFNFHFKEKIVKSKVWNPKFDLDIFPIIVQRRLTKEKLLDKKLNPASMIKAMIIKIGEMGRPFINYEVVDFSIRELFTYLGEKKYTRVDREIEFLKRLDNEIIKILKEGLEE